MSAEVEAIHGAVEVAEAIEASGGISALGINLQLFVAQMIHFIIVLLIFWKWIYGPIVNILDKRAETIDKGLSDAKLVEERLTKLEDDRTTIIAEAKKEATTLLEQSKDTADAREKKMVDKAKAEVNNVVQEGKRRLNQEKEAMMRDAKEEIALIAIAAAKKVVAGSIDEKTSQKIATDAIDTQLNV